MINVFIAGCERGSVDHVTQYENIEWGQLTPPDWDSMKILKSMDLSKLRDDDPRVFDLMSKIREQWENAPVVKKWNNQGISIKGYIAPLDGDSSHMKEFLLVPYFGACIHSPPPPSNQVIHVLLKQPMKGISNIESGVVVTGILKVDPQDTALGMAGYQMEDPSVKTMKDMPQ